MKNVGIFIIGTSPTPIYISIQSYLKNSIDKMIFLATKDDEYSKGTYIYAEKLKKIFYKNNIEIVDIDRSDLKKIDNKVNNIIENIKQDEDSVNVYLDFTGGTKLQSAFIRESFENNINFKKDRLNLVYVDGYDKKIRIKQKDDINYKTIRFDNIKGCDEDDNMIEIALLHGFNLDFDNGIVKAINEEGKSEFVFDDVYMREYNLEFTTSLQNEIGDNGNGKNKVKLEIFKNIIHAEQVGGSFSILDFTVEDGKEEVYRKLMDEFLGIKKNVYKNRIYFNSK